MIIVPVVFFKPIVDFFDLFFVLFRPLLKNFFGLHRKSNCAVLVALCVYQRERKIKICPPLGFDTLVKMFSLLISFCNHAGSDKLGPHVSSIRMTENATNIWANQSTIVRFGFVITLPLVIQHNTNGGQAPKQAIRGFCSQFCKRFWKVVPDAFVLLAVFLANCIPETDL